jgi:hypothetical protein
MCSLDERLTVECVFDVIFELLTLKMTSKTHSTVTFNSETHITTAHEKRKCNRPLRKSVREKNLLKESSLHFLETYASICYHYYSSIGNPGQHQNGVTLLYTNHPKRSPEEVKARAYDGGGRSAIIDEIMNRVNQSIAGYLSNNCGYPGVLLSNNNL